MTRLGDRVRFGLAASFSAMALGAAVVTPAFSALAAEPATAAAEAPGGSAMDDLAACLAEQRSGDLLILIDTSGSLAQSDPENSRVTAARYLVEQWNTVAKASKVELNVAVAGFSDDYERAIGFTPLSSKHSDVLSALDGFKTKNSGAGTDYWNALDGARRELASRARGQSAAGCQGIVWFSDGKLDPTVTDGQAVGKPYLTGKDAKDNASAAKIARSDLCRKGGLADQIRASGVTTLGIGLSRTTATPEDFELMRGIVEGKGISCGERTDPVPGMFQLASDIDGLLFAFDAVRSPGQKGLVQERKLCAGKSCAGSAQAHSFVLDDTINQVHAFIAGQDPVEGLRVQPPGQAKSIQLALPEVGKGAKGSLGKTPYSVDRLSDKSISIDLDRSSSGWTGQWQLWVESPAKGGKTATSRITVSGDVVPALGAPDGRIYSGDTVDVKVSLKHADGTALDTSKVRGKASVDVVAIDPKGEVTTVATGLPLSALGKPVKVATKDLGVGTSKVRASLALTTAPVTRGKKVVVPGTSLAVQRNQMSLDVLPPAGYPTVASAATVDFGSTEGPADLSVDLPVTGPGCVWVDPSETEITGSPEGLGEVRVGATEASSASDCVEVAEGESSVPLTLTSSEAGNGGMTGNLSVHVAPKGEPDRAQVVSVPFTADFARPADIGVRWAVWSLVFLAGLGIPVGLLYLAKRRSSVIPGLALFVEQIPVTLDGGEVLRDGMPLSLGSTDLRELVYVPAKGTRSLEVHGARLAARTGLSPLGVGQIAVTAPGAPVVTSTGESFKDGAGKLPLAVHNSWFAWPDAGGARLVVLASGDLGASGRQQLVDAISDRLPRALAQHVPEGAEIGAGRAGGVDSWTDVDSSTDDWASSMDLGEEK